MKKIFILLFLATATSFVSCNKDDDNAQNTAELLIGSWEFSQEGMIVGGSEILENYEHAAPECGMDYIMFNENNTGSTYYFYEDEECETDIDEFIYSINGNVITFEGDYPFQLTIMSIDNISLKIKDSDEAPGVLIMTKK